MRPIEFVFEADDGRPLAGTVLEPARADGAVVIASATGVPRRIYAGIARHLAEAGLAVLTFDYRGIGDSRQGPLRREPARMQDWGGWTSRARSPGCASSTPAPRCSSSATARAGSWWGWLPPRATSRGRRWSARSWAGPATGRGPGGG